MEKRSYGMSPFNVYKIDVKLQEAKTVSLFYTHKLGAARRPRK